MIEPTWLKPLAIATLEQAFADMLKDEEYQRVLTWCSLGGRLGRSDWKVCDILNLKPEYVMGMMHKLRDSGLKELPPVKDWLRKVFEGLE